MQTGAAGRLNFGPFSVDFDRCALWKGAQPVHLRPKTFDVLHHLAMRSGAVVPKATLIEAVWGGVAVSDDSLVQCIKELRLALDDSEQAIIKTIPRRGYLFAAETYRAQPSARANVPVGQAIRFGWTRDGVRIAVSDAGEGAPVLVTPSWFGHLEHDWRNPIVAPLLQMLCEGHRVVRFDIRGTGLSDRNVSTFTLDELQADCEAASSATQLHRYALFGLSTTGTAIAVSHAVAHPDRVSKLILHGGFVHGRKRRNSGKDAEVSDALLTLLRHGWSDKTSPFLQMFASRYLPAGSRDQIDAMGELQERVTSSEIAARLWTFWNEIDLTELLPLIRVPTLVVHSRSNDVSPLSEGLRIASTIPNATLVVLDTANHVPIPGEPAWGAFKDAVTGFLAS